MVALKLTATKIDRYKPSKRDEILTDGNGLSLRFRRAQDGSVARTWLYVYKAGTKSVYLTLGEHGSTLSDFDTNLYGMAAEGRLSLEVARRIAAEIKDWRKRGIDPKAHIEEAHKTAVVEAEAKARSANLLETSLRQDSLTVRDLFDTWIVDGVRRKDGNLALRRLFEKDVLPRIGATAIKVLTEHEIRSVLRAQVGRGVNRTAVMTRNSLTQMFSWGRKRQPWRRLLVDGDPMELIEIEKIVSPDYDLTNESDRILSANEIAELWTALKRSENEYRMAPNKRLAAQPLEKKTQYAIWIMLSTLCRVGEMTMARWEHVNFQDAEWHIPKANVKRNVAHLFVYLSPFSLEQFRLLKEVTGYSEWCFPARSNESHMDIKAIAKQIGDRQSMFKSEKADKVQAAKTHRRRDNSLVLANGRNGSWSPHDLRRTGATMMQALGTSLETIDRCQNHIIFGSKVRRVYLRHDYAKEKREAWSRLGSTLQSIIAAVNIDDKTEINKEVFTYESNPSIPD
ncbi:site-specific integrase [Herbaspirillum sp. SJZ107]|uniref:tyrosine-type recombinase/integrase n=1 Tax=Herbaspirillum sp. SJZ107 TaxID=2572881 RepID=UPI0011529673|nr:site-specific integrase [Herbaspirillum sp. SJZ107]TQK07853.1 uncharacterized protein DUF4102 [Herbaspirillum sp. SJZ107]